MRSKASDELRLAWLVIQHADKLSQYGESHGCCPDDFGAGCCVASYCGDREEVQLAREILARLLFPQTAVEECLASLAVVG